MSPTDVRPDAHEAGRIITDFTFLLKDPTFRPISATLDEDGETHGPLHYEVKYDLVVIVEGRNLRYEAKYPSGSRGKTQKMGQISIAAAFLPGTN